MFRWRNLMRDMREHLEKLRDEAAECAMISAEAQTREKRELFANLAIQLMALADQVERASAASR